MNKPEHQVKVAHRGGTGSTSSGRANATHQTSRHKPTVHETPAHSSAARGSSAQTIGPAPVQPAVPCRWADIEDRAPHVKRPFPSDPAYFLG